MELSKSYNRLDSNIIPCLRQDFLNESDKERTRVFLVPKLHLFGIQPREAYSGNSRREAQKYLAQEEKKGYLSLLQNPSLVVPIFAGDTAYLAITDGHHRARYLDRIVVPSRIVPVEHATEIYNRNTTKPLTCEQFTHDIVESMHTALKSFDNMPLEKKSSPIMGARTIEELMARFEELPAMHSNRYNMKEMTPGHSLDLLEEAGHIAEREERRRDFFDNMNA